MRALITGANGFIGRNLAQRLMERADTEVIRVTREAAVDDLPRAVASADIVFHLAGVNRPADPAEFETGNVGLTARLGQALRDAGRPVPVVFASSTQAALDNQYGRSKRAAEESLRQDGRSAGAPVYLFRLPNVFGKWSRPNYNSAVATFCHNIARELPISVRDPLAPVTLVYIDDVVTRFIALLEGGRAPAETFEAIGPVYETTVGELADQIRSFRNCRTTLLVERVGTGLTRALYSTYVSFLPTSGFSYPLPAYGDPRGTFVELLKTRDSGQFSYFTAHPGVTRGGHYHHSKTEKFLVIRGKARFRFRNLATDERHEVVSCGDRPEVVETVPGWAHDVTNIGAEELIVMLWANEIFDRALPDTVASGSLA